MKTDLFIIGAQKAATTTLFEILATSPRISGASEKEPHFFSTEPDWRAALSRYEALFEQRHDAIYLEASTSYTFYPQRNLELWEDIHEYNPEARFIYILRNPLDRIVAAYRHSRARGYGQGEFADYVLKTRITLNVTRYFTQIMPFIRRFGREQVLLLDFDDFIADQAATLRQVSGFIGLPEDHFADAAPHRANMAETGKLDHRLDRLPEPISALKQRFPGTWDRITGPLHREAPDRPEIDPCLRRAIGNLLEAEIRGVEELTGRDYARWRESLR